MKQRKKLEKISLMFSGCSHLHPGGPQPNTFNYSDSLSETEPVKYFWVSCDMNVFWLFKLIRKIGDSVPLSIDSDSYPDSHCRLRSSETKLSESQAKWNEWPVG